MSVSAQVAHKWHFPLQLAVLFRYFPPISDCILNMDVVFHDSARLAIAGESYLAGFLPLNLLLKK